MGETFVAVANDPSAIYWNPAGLASLQRREVAFSHVQWPADVTYEHVTLILPSRRLGGSVAMQFGVLGTDIDETSEQQPFGTGRTFMELANGLSVFPGAAIMLAVLGFNFAGDGLRDVLDPRLRGA